MKYLFWPFLFFWKYKLKISLFLVLTLLFFLLLFPTRSLRDLVTLEIYQKTGGKVYVLFNRFHISLFPPSFSIENLKITSSQLPQSLELDLVKLSPLKELFLKQEPSGEVELTGLFKGKGKLKVEPGKKLENGNKNHLITLDLEGLRLQELGPFVGFNQLTGQLKLNSKGHIDPSFLTSPDLDFQMIIKNFEIPPTKVPTQLGPIDLPSLKAQEIEIKGRWSSGKINIEELKFGKINDDLSILGKGYLSYSIENQGNKLISLIGSYQADLDIRVSSQIESQLYLMLGLLDSYKSAISNGSRYKFRLNGVNLRSVPNFSPSQM